MGCCVGLGAAAMVLRSGVVNRLCYTAHRVQECNAETRRQPCCGQVRRTENHTPAQKVGWSWNSVTTLLVRGLHSMQYSVPSEASKKSKHSCSRCNQRMEVRCVCQCHKIGVCCAAMCKVLPLLYTVSRHPVHAGYGRQTSGLLSPQQQRPTHTHTNTRPPALTHPSG